MKSARGAPVGDLSIAADRLHSAAIHLLRSLRKTDIASGLSGPRLSALSVIVFAGPLSLGALAAAEQVRPPTMTRIVTALERLGLVTREPDPDDARALHIRATKEGVKVLHAGRKRRVAELAERIAALQEPERKKLLAALSVLEDVTRSAAH
ncbi:MAG TPA: MarR family transcriptional regulator [Gemmatimonadaceae bacterium]|nr:MarR family transcriptional regulator [Gemmatimonadaceae bacterium]